MVKVAPRHCPFCDHEVDGASPMEGEAGDGPSAGDFLMCIQCGQFGVEAGDGTMRKPEALEIVMIALDPMCRRAAYIWSKMKDAMETRQ